MLTRQKTTFMSKRISKTSSDISKLHVNRALNKKPKRDPNKPLTREEFKTLIGKEKGD